MDTWMIRSQFWKVAPNDRYARMYGYVIYTWTTPHFQHTAVIRCHFSNLTLSHSSVHNLAIWVLLQHIGCQIKSRRMKTRLWIYVFGDFIGFRTCFHRWGKTFLSEFIYLLLFCFPDINLIQNYFLIRTVGYTQPLMYCIKTRLYNYDHMTSTLIRL